MSYLSEKNGQELTIDQELARCFEEEGLMPKNGKRIANFKFLSDKY